MNWIKTNPFWVMFVILLLGFIFVPGIKRTSGARRPGPIVTINDVRIAPR